MKSLKRNLLGAAALATVLVLAVGCGQSKDDGAESRSGPARSQLAGGPAATDQDVLNRIHQADQMEIQLAGLAADHSQSAEVKDYAQALASDHRQADQQVTDLAKRLGVSLRTYAPLGTVSAPPAANPPTGATPPAAAPPTGATPPAAAPPTGATPPAVAPPTGATPPAGAPPTGATPPAAAPPAGANPPTAQPPAGPNPPAVNPPGATSPSAASPAELADRKSLEQAFERLQSLRGPEFDRVFLQTNVTAHSGLIAAFSGARNGLSPDVGSLLDKLLPKLQSHLDMAKSLLASLNGGKEGKTPAPPAAPNPSSQSQQSPSGNEVAQP